MSDARSFAGLQRPPICLTVSASDSTGGSLAQADIKTFTALGTYGVAVHTGVLAQSFTNTWDLQPVGTTLLRAQLEALDEALPVGAVKVGMVPTAALIHLIGRWLRSHPELPVVVDPVLTNQVGIPNLEPEVIQALQEELLPRATIVTPNRFEAAQLAGMEEVLVREDMEEAAQRLFDSYGCPTVITGGGLQDEVLDVFCGMDGVSHFSAPMVTGGGRPFGAGCTYAAAITAELARGEGLREAILVAKSYVGQLIAAAAQMQPESDAPRPLWHCLAVSNLAQGDGIGVKPAGS